MAYDFIATYDYYHKRMNVEDQNSPVGSACIKVGWKGGGLAFRGLIIVGNSDGGLYLWSNGTKLKNLLIHVSL